MAKVHLDAGHGGKDPGATGQGLREKDIALSITLKVGKILERHGVKVSYSRKTDKFVELSQRAKMANKAKADVFVSIHCNAFEDKKAQGVEVFHYPNKSEGKKLAKSILDSIINAKLYTKNRGIKTDTFIVLKKTKMTAVVVELGFITNKEDAKILSGKQDAFAIAIAKGILNNYLGIPYKAPQAKPAPSGKLYRVQVGAFKNKDNADKLAKELKSKGYDAFIREGKE